jgi:dienelactone hydrolase
MRSVALRLLAAASFFAALAMPGCVDVKQDPPLSRSDPFTVAEFNTATGKVPFPITLPCPRPVDPTTGACPGGGTYDATRNRVAVPIAPCQAGQTPCLAPGEPAGCVACDSATAAQLKAGLNTLDGFSTYAPLRTTFDKDIDPASVRPDTALLLNPATGSVADFNPTLVTVDPDKPYKAISLIFEPRRATSGNVTTSIRPLRSFTDYLAILRTASRDSAGNFIGADKAIKDTTGRPIEPDRSFAILRARNPVANADGTAVPGSILEGLRPSDVGCTGTAAEQQACLNAFRASTEATRVRFDAIFRALEASALALPREQIALLWPVKTQSIANALVGIRASIIAPRTVPPTMTRSDVLGQSLYPGVLVYQGRIAPADVKVSNFHLGCILSPMFLRPPTATFRVDANGLPVIAPHFIPYVLAKPKDVSPPYKVVIYAHGFTRWKYDMITMANAMAAAGFATIAIDHVWHGDRANHTLGAENTNPENCKVSAPGSTPPVFCTDPNGTFTPDPNNPAGGTCSAGTPIFSGQNFLSLNLFAVRDNVRQAAIDQMQLVQALIAARTAQGEPEFDASNIYYVGQSLGSIVGTAFLATEPAIGLGVLNVGGGSWTNILLGTQTVRFCKPLVDGLALAGVCTRADPTNKPCECQPTGVFRNFVSSAQWAIDQGDGINYANHLIETPIWCRSGTTVAPCSTLPAGTPLAKKILAQTMQNDQVVPTQTQYDLRAAIGPRSCFREFSGGTNHSFLFYPGDPAAANFAETRAVTEEAIRQIAHFFLSGGTTTKVGGTAADACPQ